MKLPQRHKDILIKEKEEIENSKPTTFKGGYNWININYKDVIIENLQVTEFNLMYPHIMVLLHDEGLIDIKNESDKLKWFFKNRKDLKLISNNSTNSEYHKWKVWVNSLYGQFGKQHSSFNTTTTEDILTKGPLIHGLMSKYLYELYDEILENNPHNIVYIDTDRIISVNNTNLLDCPLPYSTDNLTLGVFKEKKRYVVYDGGDIKVKGYPVRQHEEVKREVQSKVRQFQLEKLGITE